MIQNDIINDFWNSGLWEAIKITGLGMLGIFIVTGIIISVIYALGYFANRDPKNDTKKED